MNATPHFLSNNDHAVATDAAAAVAVASTDEQRAILERIARQRQRLAARRARDEAHVLTRQTIASAHAPRVDANAPLLTRVATFARLHPVATAVVLGAGLALGPVRLLRLASFAVPIARRLLKY